jgi:quinol monooxygenase YgiN
MIQRSESEIAIIAQFTAKEGKADELLAAIHKVMCETLKEPGCKRFVLHQHVEDPKVLTVVEKFADQKAFDTHVAAPYTKHLLEKVAPEIVATQSITFHKEVLP